MTPPPPQLAPVDVGISLGELNGHTVVVFALATAGITTQGQLPPASAVQLATGILAAAAAAGADIGEALEQLRSATSSLEVPNPEQTAHLLGRTP